MPGVPDSAADEEVVAVPPQRRRTMENIVIPAWQCKLCAKECIPVRSESRCLCGHRLKHHKQDGDKSSSAYRCCERGCNCPSFFYIVAEGSWILRCRCKHKHTDHDPASHKCKKANCACLKFQSPWVCNCDHSWEEHEMIMKLKQISRQALSLAEGVDLDPAMLLTDGRGMQINPIVNRGI